MDTQAILANLRQQRDQLDSAITALESLNGAGKRRGRPPGKRRTMSAAARAKIAAAQRKRWAAQKKSGVIAVRAKAAFAAKSALPKI